ncbi:LOW QUALITY PROTEIN: anoctamin-1-like [Pomacea canaliculata]|uniref:LOW QUALITY PROTEIN: anoctamin-1-like n=1 Tax=Pomacea canaliculata TaxID=400727 RepID=UPI000D738DF5|nr:LOW QUALITY PROTEIN: anoctamin-1-like [Pomacea canaliculata]
MPGIHDLDWPPSGQKPTSSSHAFSQLHDKTLYTFSSHAGLEADGVEERHSVNHESDEDADGQATDPSRTKPKDTELFDLDSQTRNMYFDDKARKIDFILAWSIKPNKKSIEAQRARELFENNLKQEGLELEYDKKGDEIHYAKIHAPYEVLRRYADILKLRLPMKQKLASQHGKKFEDLQSPVQAVSTRLWGAAGRFFKRLMRPFEVDREKVPPIKRTYTCPYSSDKEYLFEIPEDKESLFTNACRSWIVDFILRRKSFSEDKQKAYSFGVKKMISDGYYTAAFPLHEGHWKPGSADNERKLLFDHWAWWKNCFKFQPLDYVRHYYGEKIGLYFAWLGFYTAMLVPASFVGLVVFFYGLAIRYTNVASKELCDTNVNITMCPLCDTQCPYWFLHEACSHAAASRIFDNGATVFFAIFMSLWGTLFLEFWKRNEATIQYKWDLTNFVSEEEPPRPEYLSKLEDWNTMKVNPVTGLKEPHLPFWRRRVPVFLCSYAVMLFLAAVAIVSVVGVIAYRVSMLAALQLIPDVIVTANSSNIKALTVDLVYQNASLVTTVTAALINLVIIIVLNFVSVTFAFWLTDWECLRTQSEYDNSITIKLFALQFVNYFSSIVYIAFFKGRFVGRPGRYNTIFGARQEECEAGGCLIELCIQLAIIMVGKQLIQNNLIEIGLPKLIKLLKRKCSKETREQKLAHTPWEKDYKLEPAANTSLFYEYLEMVLQFGFLTIFCAAFPLAPLFALLNNIIEIRVDASKFITQLRRPIAERAATIGIWYSVLYGISRIAIISNAFIIALTSDFIPRLVYEMRYSPDQSLSGYVNFSLAIFNTSDFERNHQPAPALRGDIQVCRYRDFRNPPWHENKYEYSDVFWHVLAARLAFVVVFENVVVVVTSLIAWLIPDVPTPLKEQIRREAYITSEIVLRTELNRARGEDVIVNSQNGSGDGSGYNSARYSPHNSEDMDRKIRHRQKADDRGDEKSYV